MLDLHALFLAQLKQKLIVTLATVLSESYRHCIRNRLHSLWKCPEALANTVQEDTPSGKQRRLADAGELYLRIP